MFRYTNLRTVYVHMFYVYKFSRYPSDPSNQKCSYIYIYIRSCALCTLIRFIHTNSLVILILMTRNVHILYTVRTYVLVQLVHVSVGARECTNSPLTMALGLPCFNLSRGVPADVHLAARLRHVHIARVWASWECASSRENTLRRKIRNEPTISPNRYVFSISVSLCAREIRRWTSRRIFVSFDIAGSWSYRRENEHRVIQAVSKYT